MTETCLISRISSQNSNRVANVLCAAFFDYPVMRYVLGAGEPDYGHRLQRLVNLFVAARVLRDEPMYGVQAGSELIGAMTTSVPDGREDPQFAVLREAVWRELGAEARARYDRCTAAWGEIGGTMPQVHVNMIGVLAPHRGTGLARRLLHEAHELARVSGDLEGVTLTTEDPRNVAFYQHLGYQVVGHASISPELETRSFFRPNRG